jgi:hypothetical protein
MKHNHQQIECPNCGTAFELDKNKFASIISQVKEIEIDRQVSEKVRILKDKLDSESKLAINNAQSETKESVEKLKKEVEILQLKNQEQLKGQKDQIDLAVAKSKNEYEQSINKINLDTKKTIDNLQKEVEILQLKNQEQLKNQSTQIELEIERKKNIFEKDSTQKIEEISSQYKQEINLLEGEVARLKDFQSKLSTKMIGETLEHHCQTLFDLRQADGCFPNAKLLKDNDVVNGTKGDFIFKDYDEDGNEIISVMLEMKNQSEIGNIKKKNSDHYSKLDKDRTNKNCEYSILVSTLEPDNEFFNRGIVQVREFKNMYVVRPNSLLILLSFITSFARKTLDEKREIIKLKNMNIDLANFEDNLANAKELMQVNTDRVTANFAKSIVEIDKIISQLEKHKSTLQKIDSNFQIANRKAQDITVKKLTYKNTFMQRVFQKIREEKKNAQ